MPASQSREGAAPTQTLQQLGLLLLARQWHCVAAVLAEECVAQVGGETVHYELCSDVGPWFDHAMVRPILQNLMGLLNMPKASRELIP
jgi:hypothetical protein